MKKALVILLKIIIFFIGWAIIAGIIEIPNDNPSVWRFYAELIPLVVMVVFTVVFLKFEKNEVKIPIQENAIKGTLVGIISGIIWIAFSAGILLGTKQLLIIGETDVSMAWLWISSAFINVIMQELLVHGYIYQLLKTRYNLKLAVIITTAIFTFLHGGAFEAGSVAVINVITMCLFTTAIYEAENTILAPIMAHTIWNIVGAIFLGCVSLSEDYPSMLLMKPMNESVISGGAYMAEGSIIVLAVNTILMFFFLMKYKKKNSKINPN